MSRTIKFRAWDKEAKEMLYWDKWAMEIKDAIPDDAGDEWSDQCEVMQFTGLKDSKGKEIYEGDILLWSDGYKSSNYTTSVIFEDGSFKDSNGSKLKPYDSGGATTVNLKVIGNIYESPEKQ